MPRKPKLKKDLSRATILRRLTQYEQETQNLREQLEHAILGCDGLGAQVDRLTADGVRKDETIRQLESRILNLHDQRNELQRAHEAATNRELIMDGIASDMRAIALNLSEALKNGRSS